MKHQSEDRRKFHLTNDSEKLIVLRIRQQWDRYFLTELNISRIYLNMLGEESVNVHLIKENEKWVNEDKSKNSEKKRERERDSL